MANKYVKQEKYGLLLLVELVHVLSWSVTETDLNGEVVHLPFKLFKKFAHCKLVCIWSFFFSKFRHMK